MISARERGHCGQKFICWKYGLTNKKFCTIRQNTHFLRVIYSLQIFSLGCTKTQWGDGPKFGAVVQCMVDENMLFVCRYIDLFRSYAL